MSVMNSCFGSKRTPSGPEERSVRVGFAVGNRADTYVEALVLLKMIFLCWAFTKVPFGDYFLFFLGFLSKS